MEAFENLIKNHICELKLGGSKIVFRKDISLNNLFKQGTVESRVAPNVAG